MKRETKILKADHNPIKVGDNVLVDAKTKTKKRRKPTPEMGNNGNKPPRPPA
jgi:hypothetical protein